MRRLRTRAGARGARPGRTRRARRRVFPALTAEVESASLVLDTPAARLIARGEERPLLLEEVEALLASKALVVDACRHVVRDARTVVSLARRPVLFALARALGEAWPARRAEARAPRTRLPREARRRIASRAAARRDRAAARGAAAARRRERDEARLRAGAARCARGRRAGAARRGASMRPCSPSSPTANRGRARPWRLRSAASQRTVQRALDALAAAGKVQSFGRGRARRWMTPPVPGFATTLLLPAPLPSD